MGRTVTLSVRRAAARSRVEPRICLVVTAAMALCAATTPDGAVARFAALATVAIALAVEARTGLRALARSLAPVAFLAAIGVTAALLGAPAAAPVGFVARIVLLVVLVAALQAECPLLDLLAALRWFRVPSEATSLVVLADRYLGVLSEEAGSMGRAYRSRLGQGGWRGAIALGRLSGALMVRASDRSDRIADAMVARGFTGELPLPDLRRPAPRDVAVLAAVVAGAAAISAWARP